jgi:hypothetical protein
MLAMAFRYYAAGQLLERSPELLVSIVVFAVITYRGAKILAVGTRLVRMATAEGQDIELALVGGGSLRTTSQELASAEETRATLSTLQRLGDVRLKRLGLSNGVVFVGAGWLDEMRRI